MTNTTLPPIEYPGFDALTQQGKAAYHKGYERGLVDGKLERESGEAAEWRNRCHAADREYQELMEKYLALKGEINGNS